MEVGTERCECSWWGVSWACQQTEISVAGLTVCLLQGQFHILVPWPRHSSPVTISEQIKRL
jgi:hypothetical protein